MTHWWTWLVPALAAMLLAVAGAIGAGPLVAGACAVALVGAVFAAVHHAEVVAHRVGEPFGTLVLAVAVTVIEASLILSVMFAGGPDKAALPRDTIYAAVMIICNVSVRGAAFAAPDRGTGRAGGLGERPGERRRAAGEGCTPLAHGYWPRLAAIFSMVQWTGPCG